MDIYRTEDEQVEAIRRFWNRYGTWLLIGLAAVLLLVLGWQSWQRQQAHQAEAESAQFDAMVEAMESDQVAAESAGRALIADNPASIYAQFAAMNLARLAIEQGKTDEAIVHLRWVTEHATQDELGQNARLRLAMALAENKQFDEARAAIENEELGKFRPLADELLGDIYVTVGERDKARAAYRSAFDGLDPSVNKRAQIQLKLDDLAEVEEKAE